MWGEREGARSVGLTTQPALRASSCHFGTPPLCQRGNLPGPLLLHLSDEDSVHLVIIVGTNRDNNVQIRIWHNTGWCSGNSSILPVDTCHSNVPYLLNIPKEDTGLGPWAPGWHKQARFSGDPQPP